MILSLSFLLAETWNYNWQTKELKIPPELTKAGEAVSFIEDGMKNLAVFYKLMSLVTTELKPTQLQEMELSVKSFFENYTQVRRKIETTVNALKLYWFPENGEQFELGGYKRVKQQPITKEIDFKCEPRCSICQELFNATNSLKPVIFKRRCKLIPMLRKCCDLEECSCLTPPLCLKCALDHFVRNGLHEGRSSVKCPNCRGEFCIYDFQEVDLVPDPRIALEEEWRKFKEEKLQFQKEKLEK